MTKIFWQKAESAPKDGSWFIAMNAQGEVTKAKWWSEQEVRVEFMVSDPMPGFGNMDMEDVSFKWWIPMPVHQE